MTQGISAEDAKRQLDDAVQGWFEDCIERGTLGQALRECGFRTATREESEASDGRVMSSREHEADDLFSVRVTIPAYHAAALMAEA